MSARQAELFPLELPSGTCATCGETVPVFLYDAKAQPPWWYCCHHEHGISGRCWGAGRPAVEQEKPT